MLKQSVIDNMKEIAEHCMGEETAACVATCPMHTNVKEYVRLIREGKGEEAIKVIRDQLFLPGTLGRICAHPCEGKCKWNEGKSPMAIASLKRYAADHFDREEDWNLSCKDENGKKVAVIGAGPSGLQAALELRKEGCQVTVFEKMPVRGGMLRIGIPAYRLPRTILEREISYLDHLGVKFELNCEIGKNKPFSEILENFDSVIVAVGKQQGRVDRSLDHWDAKGIFSAAGFLKEAAMTQDVKESGKVVLVVGGGDVAVDCARTARRLNAAEKVYSVCLEDSYDTMASSNHEIKGALAEGVKFNHAQAIQRIHTDENGRVSGVTLKKCLSMFDENGRFAPTYDEEDTRELKVDTIVFAIGQGVEAEFAGEILEQRPNSTFACDKDTLQSTKNEKIFVAGDASGESVIAIQALATGRRAAQSVIRFLRGEDLRSGRELKDTWTYETKLQMPVDWDAITGQREDMQELDPKKRIHSFDEVALGYTKEEAEREAARCRQCECKLCMKECIMLNDYTECPKSLFKKYLEEGYENLDHMIAYSCNECSQCTLKCPKEFNMKGIFTALKEDYAEKNNGLVPLEILKESDRTQEKECGDEYCTRVDGSLQKKEVHKKQKTKYVFVPGCTVSAYSPKGVENIVKHLKECLGHENVGALLQCCGKVTRFIGETEKFEERNKKAIDILDDMGAEVIITVCPSCYKVFKETAKNQKVIAYWDLMKNLIGIPETARGIGKGSDVVFNIHDSCVTRDETSHHESVRWVLDELGYNWTEIERNGKNTRCCGVGGMVCSSNPELYERVYTRRANDFDQHNIVTYCGSCRGTMQAAGKDAVHILDLLFGQKYTKDQEGARGYQTEQEMWEKRLETKERLNHLR
ncbi:MULTISPECIES: FAD-dependent oxidoreductase [Blautia]|jgi:NADPH-dependent glutamate synthase beta subunit-like oxidoreductase|uniref:FAD-dependent oxidoreductase n=1 Tax=Blautia TaxID=572511 RepID=UPI000E4A0040|nr:MULTISPECIES: FAD-dependent oxidoreductase [Blautia]RHO11922.1 FAD-binding protein [Ruminococcus sp. AM18-44]RHO20892.1 FAD-binding protein [Ruminococcus sp. AM18-15]RHQ30826.1 FAD-binding protein [Ruminococcus sp. AF25-28AC]RHS57818.1 FAD-binding protein [Ruminococcus sp. AM45-9BH]RHS68941.1 FAD-binding protein [Ruminococcus sp. AM45-2]RHS72247.1 FAD-binding protein [Ruminococcus sp. AM44-9AT]